MEIKTKFKRQRFSVYYEADEKEVGFLAVPNIESPEHDHFHMTLKEAKKLRDELTKILRKHK